MTCRLDALLGVAEGWTNARRAEECSVDVHFDQAVGRLSQLEFKALGNNYEPISVCFFVAVYFGCADGCEASMAAEPI